MVVALAPIPGAVSMGKLLFSRGITVLHCHLTNSLMEWAPQGTRALSSACPCCELQCPEIDPQEEFP